jgi:hypothetical protein
VTVLAQLRQLQVGQQTVFAAKHAQYLIDKVRKVIPKSELTISNILICDNCSQSRRHHQKVMNYLLMVLMLMTMAHR